MSNRDRGPVLRGYIVGDGKNWHAICLDLDITVDGESLEEARTALDIMVADYMAEVRSLPESEQKKLLKRRSPLLTRIGYDLGYLVASVFRNRNGDRLGFILHSDQFSAHCPI